MGLFGNKDKKTSKKTPVYQDTMVQLPDELLEDDNAKEDPEKKPKKTIASPFPVYFVLFSSIFFSLGFLVYRKVDTFIKSGQAVSPTIDFKFNPETIFFYFKKATGNISTNLAPQEIEKNLEQELKDNIRNWGIHVEVYPNSATGSSRFWSYNSSILGDIKPSDLYYLLKNQAPQKNSFLATDLPQGVVIKQNYSETNQEVRLDVLLSVPTKDMLISLKAVSQVDLGKVKKTLPKLISIIYWSFSGLD